ncbi:hypothetical protein D3C81_2120660 [compost metagenome]
MRKTMRRIQPRSLAAGNDAVMTTNEWAAATNVRDLIENSADARGAHPETPVPRDQNAAGIQGSRHCTGRPGG